MILYFIFLIYIYLSFFNEVLMNKLFNNQYNLGENKNFFRIGAMALTILFLGLRYENGWDYMQYYYTIQNYLETNIVSRGEFANNFFIYFARILGSPIYFFLGNALIQLILISKTLSKYSENYWISMIFYITFPLFFLNSFSVVRMFTAISITFFGYKYIVERKPIRYFILIILAAGFHMTALLAIIFYPLSLIKVKRLTIILVLFLGTFTLSFANLFVTKYFPVYLVYLNKSGVQEGTKAIYVFLLIGLFILIYFDRFIKNNFSAMFYLFGLLIYIAFLGYGTVSHRLSLYGTIYSTLLIPKIINFFPKRIKYLIILFFLIFCLIMFYFTLKVGNGTYIPYKLFFNSNK